MLVVGNRGEQTCATGVYATPPTNDEWGACSNVGVAFVYAQDESGSWWQHACLKPEATSTQLHLRSPLEFGSRVAVADGMVVLLRNVERWKTHLLLTLDCLQLQQSQMADFLCNCKNPTWLICCLIPDVAFTK